MFKKMLAFLGLGVSGAAMAAEGDGAIDVSAATGALQSMETALQTYWTAAQPIIVSILGVALVVFLIFLGWKLFKKATNKA